MSPASLPRPARPISAMSSPTLNPVAITTANPVVTMSTRPLAGAATDRTTALTTDVTMSTGPSTGAATANPIVSTMPLAEAATDGTTALTTDVAMSTGPSIGAATDGTDARTSAALTLIELAEEEKGVPLKSVRAIAIPGVPGRTLTVTSAAKKMNASEKTNSPGAGEIGALILANLVVEMTTFPEPAKQRGRQDAQSMMKAANTTASALGLNQTGVAP